MSPAFAYNDGNFPTPLEPSVDAAWADVQAAFDHCATVGGGLTCYSFINLHPDYTVGVPIVYNNSVNYQTWFDEKVCSTPAGGGQETCNTSTAVEYEISWARYLTSRNFLKSARGKMENPDSVSIDALRKTINGIFDFIEKDLGIKDVELKQNYYWSIADDVLYAMESPPKQPDVGSLRDDWDFVLSASTRDQQIPIDFIHVAPLLRALAQAVPSYTSPDGPSKK